MNASRTPCTLMQDHLQQTVVTEQAASKTKKNNAANEAMEAATQAREWQTETRRLCEQKCQDATEAETIHSEAIKDTLEKTEVIEKHVKNVIMRGGILGGHGGRLLQKHSS